MAGLYPSERISPRGEIDLITTANIRQKVFYTPNLSLVQGENASLESYKRKILDISRIDQTIQIYLFRVDGDEPMAQRYPTLKTITLSWPWLYNLPTDVSELEDLIQSSFPKILTLDYDFGFGFRRDYHHMASAMNSEDIEHLFILHDVGKFKKKAGRAVVDRTELMKVVKKMDVVVKKAREVSSLLRLRMAKETMPRILKNEVFKLSPGLSSDELKELNSISVHTEIKLQTAQEQRRAIEILEGNGKRIFNNQPERLFKLRNNIDLISLEALIDRFELMMSKSLPESIWQNIFTENPFVLSMAFGAPFVAIQSQAFVGGQKLSGDGSKIADFLVKNTITQNAAIIEIKKPSSNLISNKSYRSELFGPSSELSGGVTQVLDQINRFEKNVQAIKESSRIYNFETYAVVGILVIGLLPNIPEKQKSFELYRGNSQKVIILTFDELFSKLKMLHEFLKGN